jgi:hypothetical protein
MFRPTTVIKYCFNVYAANSREVTETGLLGNSLNAPKSVLFLETKDK